jgi:hypothetical protein
MSIKKPHNCRVRIKIEALAERARGGSAFRQSSSPSGGWGIGRKVSMAVLGNRKPAGSAARGGLSGATLPGEGEIGFGALLQNPLHPAALRFHLTAPLPQVATDLGRAGRIFRPAQSEVSQAIAAGLGRVLRYF